MIAYLKGRILEKTVNFVVLENSGIGYKVFVTPETLELSLGQEISLYIHMKVADDGHSLFGLPTFTALQFFELLLTVSGVGPKASLAILSSAPINSVKQAIANQDSAVFTRISGVGSKTAERIIVDLKNKMGTVEDFAGISVSSQAFDALLALGYNQREVREVVNKLDSTMPPQEQIKQALRFLGKQ